MDSTALIAEVRRWAFIGTGTSYTEYADSDILTMLTSRERADFSKAVVDAHQGQWQQTTLVSSVTDIAPVPPRAVMNGIHSIYFLSPNNNLNTWLPLSEAQVQDTWLFQNQTQLSQYPRKYSLQGDDIILLPVPQQAVQLMIKWHLRPSQLCTSQNSKNGTDRGRITAVTPGVSITVNALPFKMQQASPAAITTADSFDVLRVSGWYKPMFISQAISSIVSTTITPTDASWITAQSVKVGDYVRCENQTDWPQIPDEFHECLAQDAAAAVLNQMGLSEKEADVRSKLQPVFANFRAMLVPRSQFRSQQIYIKRSGC